MKTLLIGDNAFIGVSHLSQERARERVERLDVQSIVHVIAAALSHGASGYTFSTHPVNLEILAALREYGSIDHQFDLYPVLPYAQGSVRLANERGMTGLLNEVLSKLSLSEKAKVLLEGGLSAVKLDYFGMLATYIDAELTRFLKLKPKNASVRGVLLHEVLTDLCLGLQGSHLLDAFADHVREKYQVKPGFVTYNLPKFVNLFQDAGVSLKDVLIMTPFNSIGFQMSPSRESCETCLSNLSEGEVIAMSIMAGGFLKLDGAVDYIRTLRSLSGVAVGASSKDHAQDTFVKLSKLS